MELTIKVDGKMKSIKRAVEAARVVIHGASANDDDLEFSRAVNVKLFFDGAASSADSDHLQAEGTEYVVKLGRKYAYVKKWDNYQEKGVTERFPVRKVRSVTVTEAASDNYDARI